MNHSSDFDLWNIRLACGAASDQARSFFDQLNLLCFNKIGVKC